MTNFDVLQTSQHCLKFCWQLWHCPLKSLLRDWLRHRSNKCGNSSPQSFVANLLRWITARNTSQNWEDLGKCLQRCTKDKLAKPWIFKHAAQLVCDSSALCLIGCQRKFRQEMLLFNHKKKPKDVEVDGRKEQKVVRETRILVFCPENRLLQQK